MKLGQKCLHYVITRRMYCKTEFLARRRNKNYLSHEDGLMLFPGSITGLFLCYGKCVNRTSTIFVRL